MTTPSDAAPPAPPGKPKFSTRDDFLAFLFTKIAVNGNKVQFLGDAKELLQWYVGEGFDLEGVRTVDDVEHIVKAWEEVNAEELKENLELNFWKPNASSAVRASIISILGYVPEPIDFGE